MIAALMIYVNALGLLIGLAGLALDRICDGHGWQRRWVWVVCLGASLIFPAAMALRPHHVESAVAEPSMPPSTPKVGLSNQSSSTRPALAPVSLTDSLIPPDEPALDSPLLGLWILGSTSVLGFLAFSWTRLILRLRRSERLTLDGHTVWISNDHGPAVTGFVQPRIVIPRWLLDAPLDCRTPVLAHETEHIAARDPLLVLFALVLIVALPWNLPLWWQMRRLRFAIEVDCDARVLRRGVAVPTYGKALIRVAQHGGPGEFGAIAMSEAKSQLERRVKIMTQPRSRQNKWALVGLVGLSMSMITFAAQIESPVVPHPPTTIDAEGGAAPRSPMPDPMSDKAYAAAVAEDARIVSRLLAHPSADNLATAALFSRWLSHHSGPESPLELIRRATLLAPASPELAWLELSICRGLKCDTAAQIEKRIQVLDPDNGFLWVEDLGRSTAAGSEPEVTALVQRIGASSKITFYFNRLMVMAADALAVGDPKLGLLERGTTAVGSLAATIIPPLQPISKACRVEQLTEEGRRAACEALMSRLEQSSEIFGQMLALSIQARWWPAESPERAVIANKRRRLDYVMSESARIKLFRMNHDMALRIEAARRYDREEDAALALIKSFGAPTEPRADWKDKFHAE